MIPIDEKHMIRLAADGDMAAFEQLVTTHQPAIYRLALRMTGNPEDAADMTQEAFLRAWRGLGSFQADSSLSTWLFRLTSNVCIDFLRAARRHLVVPISGLDADGEEYTLDAPDPAKLPEEELLAREEREELRAAMDLLAPEQRQFRPDVVEILPGAMPKVLRQLTAFSPVPVIAGGLIHDQEDVIAALDAGAAAISSTDPAIWFL